MSTQARERKEKIYKWEYMRRKSLLQGKGNDEQNKKPVPAPWLRGLVHTNHYGGPGLDPRRAQTHRLFGHAEAASHIQQLEGCATMTYNYQLGHWGKKKEEDWQ